MFFFSSSSINFHNCSASASNEHHSQRIGAGTSYVGLGGVESNVKNTLIELFPVSRNFL
jgi:hypothetical protein